MPIDKINLPYHTNYKIEPEIPANQKFSAEELNQIAGKIDEVIDVVNINVADIIILKSDNLNIKNDILNLKAKDVILQNKIDQLEQNDILFDTRIDILEDTQYIWNSANRQIEVYRGGSLFSTVSLVSLDNEGTDLRYNSDTKSLELYNDDGELLDSIPIEDFVGNVATQLTLSSNTLSLKDSQGNVLSSVGFQVSNIGGLTNLLANLDTRIANEEILRASEDLKKLDKIPSPFNVPTRVILADNTTKLLSEITTDISGKVDKPTDDGTWSLKKLGDVFTWVSGVVQNIANTDLSNISARIFTQGNTFTWNTAGFFHYLKGLVDKTGQGAYTKVVVVHPTTGEMVTRDFADPAATTLAIQNSNAGQKSIMKNSLFGAVTPNTPLINLVNSYFNPKNTDVWIFASGVNISPIDPFAAWVEKSDGTRSYAISVYGISNVALQLKFNIPNDFPDGIYPVKFNYGLFSTIASITGMYLYDSTVVNYNVDLATTDFLLKGRTGFTLQTNSAIMGTNVIKLAKLNTDYSAGEDNTVENAIKTKNVFLGSADWEIKLNILQLATGNPVMGVYPYVVLTRTTDSEFNQANDIVIDYILYQTDAWYFRDRANQTMFQGVGGEGNLVIKKSGNKVALYRIASDTSVANYQEITIDTTKNYALAFMEYRSARQAVRQITIDSKIKS